MIRTTSHIVVQHYVDQAEVLLDGVALRAFDRDELRHALTRALVCAYSDGMGAVIDHITEELPPTRPVSHG
jgi:hypothetical protein